MTYKPDIADERESPALPVAPALLELGAELSSTTRMSRSGRSTAPRCPVKRTWPTAVVGADVTLLMQQHAAFDLDMVEAKARLVLDTRGVLTEGERVERL